MNPKIFLDTCVCIDVAQGVQPGADWTSVSKTLCKKFRYKISPLTVYELISGLARGGGEHFQRNREAISVLYPAGRKTFLPPLSVFMPNALFGEHRRMPYSVENDFERWVLAVLQARSFSELQSDKLIVRGKRIGLSLAEINRDMHIVRRDHARMFKFMHGTGPGTAELTHQVWADSILKGVGKPPTKDNISLVVQRLDAAYRFQARQWKFISNPQYDFEKHDSDLTDDMQLCYLCDPELYFVTTDKRLWNCTRGSTQSARVLGFSELQRLLR